MEQELSYRKQIARQLRTQFVEGIYRSDYAWPWNLGQGSLKVTENGTIWKLGYGFLFIFYSRTFSHFADIQHQRMAWPWNMGLGSFKVI